jgi:hypothetical protein
MEFKPLKSSRLKAVYFIKNESTLVIEFKDGRIYEYYGVPYATYSGLLNSNSPGKFFEINIKNKYEYERQV